MKGSPLLPILQKLKKKKNYKGTLEMMVCQMLSGGLDEMDKFPKRQKLPKLTQEVENLNL